jgi:hypothetical protein
MWLKSCVTPCGKVEEWIQVISLQVNNGVQCEELENIVGHVVF